MSGLSKSLSTAVIAVLLTAGVLVLALWLYRAKDVMTGMDKEKNPYEYNLDEFRKSPPAIYNETTALNITGTSLRALAVDQKDHIYVSVDQEIVIFTPEGTETNRFTLETPARCMAVGPEGRLYLGVENHVEVYDPSGQRVRTWTSLGQRGYITAIAVTSNCVFIADYGTRIVWHFNTEGQLKNMIGRKNPDQDHPGFIVPSPYFDVAIDHNGSLWAANPGEQTILNFSADGKIKTRWGKASMAIDDFCGCCNPSHIAITPDGSFVTSEKGIPRIKLYAQDGSFTGVIAGPDLFAENVVGMDLAVDSTGRVLVLDPARKAIRFFEPKS